MVYRHALEKRMGMGIGKDSLQSLTFQEHRDILQLRHIVFTIATVLGQQGEVLQVLSASMGGVEFRELPEHNAPSFSFFFCILDPRNGLATRQAGRVTVSESSFMPLGQKL